MTEITTEEFTPRPYQIDLYEKAVKENSIIYLPTGSGKTYISTLIVKKFSKHTLKSLEEGGKRIAFIVNTVSLVEQQSAYLARHVGISTKGYSGDMKVDFWNYEKWKSEIADHRILVMTAQIFLNILYSGYVKMKQMCLIIFDECHHAVEDHPMRVTLQLLRDVPLEEQPRIIGLSATLLNSNIEKSKLPEHLETLKTTMHSQIITINNSLDIKPFTTSPKEFVVYYDKPVQFPIMEKIQMILNETKNIVKLIKLPQLVPNASDPEFQPTRKEIKILRLLSSIEDNFTELGVYAGSKSLLLHMIQLEYSKKSCTQSEALLYTYIVSQFMILRKLINNEMDGLTESERIIRYSTDKLLKLFSCLKKFNDEKPSNQEFYCIIFAERRFTVNILCHVLKSLKEANDDFSFLKPAFVLGYNNNPYNTTRELLCFKKWNKESLLKFRSGIYNCLIATNVIDEGVDIQICSLVIHFNFPNNFRGYVQSKGRARHSSSHYILFVEKNDENLKKKYNMYKEMQNSLDELLHERQMYREKPSQSQIDKQMYESVNQSYKSKDLKTGLESIVDYNSAITLIEQYCTNLYKSKFVVLTPTWKAYKGSSDSYQVGLQLPMISPLNDEIIGPPMCRKDIAKKATAYEVCVKLHKMGELSDRLLPKTEEVVLDDLCYLFPHWQNEEKSAKTIPGTNKNERRHKIMYAESLYNAYPQENQDLYLHVFDMKPVYSMPDENRKLVFYNLLKQKSGYAILSTKKMPQVQQFPLYTKLGKLSVDIHINFATLKLTRDEIHNLKVFHTMIFNDILKVIKEYLVFDTRNLENSFLIVPVNDQWNINWDLLNNYQELRYTEPTVRGEFDSYADYELAVITPNYRSSNNVYIVTDVCDDITVLSPFPTPSYSTFADYFKRKHQQDIKNETQPMLEVKTVPSNINYIKPRKTTSLKRRRENEDFAEHLVPELCRKVEFPSLYWLKATALPSILHRLSDLLIADRLRSIIACETKIGITELKANEKWEPMIIDEPDFWRLEEQSNVEDLDDTQEEIEMEAENEESVEVIMPDNNIINTDNQMYPWSLADEPTYLYANIENVQMIDIEYYYNFINKVTPLDEELTESKNTFNVFKSIDDPSLQVPKLKVLSLNDPRGPKPSDILQALTCARCHDAFNLERLETLGDAFLKFATCIYLYEHFPTYSEGMLTAIKGKIVGNRNLYYCGVAKGIPGILKVNEFKPSSASMTPAYTICRNLQDLMRERQTCLHILFELSVTPEERFSGVIEPQHYLEIVEKINNWNYEQRETGIEHLMNEQIIADKHVADSVEALIGVYLKTNGIKAAFKLLQWFHILPEFEIDDLFSPPQDNSLNAAANVDDVLHLPEIIEERIGYKFKNRAYLLQALTHPSFIMNGLKQCYERLEFLGDALLDFLITAHIYEICSKLTPGKLTDLRSALVNNITFACLAVRHGLQTSFLSSSFVLEDVIDNFVKFQEHRNHVIDDQVIQTLLEEDECNLSEHVNVPKTLGDIFESTIGAVYLDSGKNIDKVWEVIYRIMHQEIETFRKEVPINCIRKLYETEKCCPVFYKCKTIPDTNSTLIPLDVTIQGKRIRFYGIGKNKKQAKCAAAKQALKYKDKMSLKN